MGKRGMCGDAMFCIALDDLLNVSLTTSEFPRAQIHLQCLFVRLAVCLDHYCSSVIHIFCHSEGIMYNRDQTVQRTSLVFGTNVAKNLMVP